jgi:hypothetical protein
MKIQSVKIGIAIAQRGQETDSAEQNKTTCSAAAEEPANSAEFIM